ncbi:MAG: NADH-quinone oxidoreductase subunit I [Elusimicrobia bacterium]|nr:NADH-quinone oxidoreductase subunit I [Candidatus Obscuribacterium magneticum]
MFWNLNIIFRNSVDLAKGFLVTLKYFFLPATTFQYPREKKPIPERFRGVLAFHPEICISCEMCVRVCPSAVISMAWKRNDLTKKKDLLWYQIDFGKCNVCRLCEEICPTKIKSIHHTNEFEMVFDGREDFIVRWGPTSQDTVKDEPKSQEWYKFVMDSRVEGMRRQGQRK